LISITGDNHLGIGNRNKLYYNKAFENFKHVIDTVDTDMLIIAGDSI
jgi:DNA repair exonuclease SbcCD nuclease subunit